jgi:hypothetical protein
VLVCCWWARWSTSEAILGHTLYALVLFLGRSIAPE